MRKLVFGILSLLSGTAQSQTVFSYGNQSVSKEEFLKVYDKNSMNKKPDMSANALREYVNLYSLFRMKVGEAEQLHLDTLPSIAQELDNYRKQLAKNYLTDKEVTNRMVEEAYNRTKTDLHVAHILIACNSNTTPEDTLKAFKKADSLYRVLSQPKADFGVIAKNYSDDKGSKDRGGDIGFMTALQTIYGFENAAYNTPVGKISKPFRTQFGYHIVKVLEKRNDKGEVQVAQVLITAKRNNDSSSKTALRKAQAALSELKAGAKFEDIVKKYSEDKYSIDTKGVMPPFGTGRTVIEFEQAAFALKNVGDLSQPIQTDYGYHIIKLLAKIPPKPFDSVKTQIKTKVDNDSRSQMAREMYMNKLKQSGGFVENFTAFDAVKSAFSKVVDTGVRANFFEANDFKNMNNTLFSFAGTNYKQNDFINFAEKLTRGRINGARNTFVNEVYKVYVDRTVNDYEEHHLADINPDFKNLMAEYRNGVMLFELMDKNVWGKASRDTAGLKSFYQERKSKYNWEPGFSGAIYHFKDEAMMNKGVKFLNAHPSAKDEEVYKEINSENNTEAVSIVRGHYEYNHFNDAPKAEIQKGKITKPVRNSDGTYTVVRADEIYETPTTKTLDEARGFIVAEYQDYLEKNWDAQLRTKYPVKINDAVFNSLVK